MSTSVIPIKLVFIGDNNVGKTSLCLSYVNIYNDVKNSYFPNVFGINKVCNSYDKRKFEISFLDTNDTNDLNRLERLSYFNNIVF
ncbi:hypothetical protein EIN_265170, partial [Entamoeba invadens IP1]